MAAPQATLQSPTTAQAIVDAFGKEVSRVRTESLGPVPTAEIRNTPQLISFVASSNRVIVPLWDTQPPEMRGIFRVFAGGTDADAEHFFRMFFNRFLIAHEAAHWFQARANRREATLYSNENEANRIAVGFWRTQPEGEAFLAELERLATRAAANLPDPTPQGEDPVAFFGANYQTLGRDPLKYGYYQFRFMADALRDRKNLDFGKLISTPLVLPGIETFLADVPPALKGKRVGLITNHSGIDRFAVSDIDLIAKHRDLKLVALLAPEHGIRGTVEAGEKIVDETDSRTGVPVYSLYLSEDRGPTPEMLKDVDVLVYDLQEVGGRTWTYVSTMALAMQAAARKGIPFVVLDRPNPIGGEIVEGALLDPRFKSFVGMYPIPARHGMTVGELATLFNQKYGIGANLVVARVANWRRSQWFDQTGLPWVNPSPNLRSLAALTSYPGSVYFEGTTLSEGRGTERPFEQVGAPWLDAPEVARVMNERQLPGIRFEAITMAIAPTAAKHKGQTVPAIRFVITDRQTYRPVHTSLLLIDEIRRQHPRDFAWTATIDRLTGSDKVKLAIEGGRLRELLQEWDREAEEFRETRKPYLLYR